MKGSRSFVILLHGFNVFDGGRDTVGKLKPYLRADGDEILELKYGFFGLLSTRFFNDNVARKLLDIVEHIYAFYGKDTKVHVIGHSNGCTIIHLAGILYHLRVTTAVYINPALAKDRLTPKGIGRLYVYHAPSDVPTWIAKFLPKAQFRPWGEMGRVGYRGIIDTKTVTNINADDAWERHLITKKGFKWDYKHHLGHSGIFDGDAEHGPIAYFGRDIANRLKGKEEEE